MRHKTLHVENFGPISDATVELRAINMFNIDDVIPEVYRLNPGDCSVYSLGKDINGGIYCRSLMDEETGMIDYNSLDGVSEELSNEFDELQRVVMRYTRDN